MAKLSVQERLERLREAGRKQSGQGGQQSSPAPAATSGRTTAGMTVRERLNRLKEAGRQQSPSLPTVTSQAAGETAGRKKAGRPTTAGKPGKITSPAREAERRAVEAMGNPEELGRWLDSIHNPLLGWLQIWFVRAVVLAGVLMLLFSVPRLGTVAVNLLAPPTYNSLGGLGSALERSAPEEIVVDFRPEGSWTWEGYTFSIHRAVVLDLGDEQALYYLLKVTHPNPWNREPALRDWLWAEDDLGNFYPSYRQGRLLIEQGYSTMDFGESSGNPSASYPFASYYDLWVSGIDPSATEITLRFDRWGENVLWLTVPLEGGEADG
mgnify:CR=1 FL=1